MVDIEQMIKLYHELNGNHFSISKEIGCSREYVRQVLTPMGLVATARKPVEVENFKRRQKLAKETQQHPNRKYSNEYLVDVYNKCGGHYSKIALYLGTYQSCISRVFKNQGLKELYPSRGRSN